MTLDDNPKDNAMNQRVEEISEKLFRMKYEQLGEREK
jgi:hypothetical protein